ncbi:MAG: glutathione S-transferase [Alphaproteobacteria bacterium]|nr:glutathione S-transferase [Alphaproteobacteria bacterium]
MKLFFSAASPYVRKVMVVAHELGVADRIEHLPSAAHPVKRDSTIVAHNPLGQVPTLLLDDGSPLYDSRVICEYLEAQHGKSRIFPPNGAARWRALREQTLADGLIDGALRARYEMTRPSDKIWADWHQGQIAKIQSSLSEIEKTASGLGDRVDIGTISIACALGYLDLRFADLQWRKAHPSTAAWYARFESRPSMKATIAKG